MKARQIQLLLNVIMETKFTFVECVGFREVEIKVEVTSPANIQSATSLLPQPGVKAAGHPATVIGP